jgi:hypothetical protein
LIIGDRLVKSLEMLDITDEMRMQRGPPDIAKPYGQHYIIDFDLVRQAELRESAARGAGESEKTLPRLTSCSVL